MLTGCTTLRGVRAEEKKTEKETVVGQNAEEENIQEAGMEISTSCQGVQSKNRMLRFLNRPSASAS